jgi:pentapeptide MXKDX repeat protein
MKNYLILLFICTIMLAGCNGNGMKHDNTMMESKSETMDHGSMMEKSHMKKDEMKKDSM